MSITTLQTLVDRLGEYLREVDHLDVAWHAGEPLTLPTDFYEAAIAKFKILTRAGITVRHGIQTNGTLINAGWIELFEREQIAVGVSIDGPEKLHDAHRKFRNGAGSWSRSMAGFRQLRVAGLNAFVISVLTARSLELPDEMFDFFLNSEIDDVAFNIEEIEGENKASSVDQAHIPDLYRRFLRRFLTRNRTHRYPIRIREAENAAAALLNGGMSGNAQTEIGSIISVDIDGNVSSFSPELLGQKSDRYNNFHIGNIHKSGLREILNGNLAVSLATDITRGVNKCRTECDIFRYCQGGAPANKWNELGTFDASETLYCRLSIRAVLESCVDELTMLSPLSGEARE